MNLLCKNLDSSFTNLLTNLILESMIWQFVSIVTFAFSITYTYWILVDAWVVKKDERSENQKYYMGPKFDFLNVCPFSQGVSLHFWLLWPMVRPRWSLD